MASSFWELVVGVSVLLMEARYSDLAAFPVGHPLKDEESYEDATSRVLTTCLLVFQIGQL